MTTTPTLWGNQVTISSDALAFGPKVTALANNDFAIVWSDQLDDMHGRRFDSTGNFNSTDFLFNMSNSSAKPVSGGELIQQADGSVRVFFNQVFGPGDGDVAVNFPDFDTIGGTSTAFPVVSSATDEFLRDATDTMFNDAPSSAIVFSKPRGNTGVSDLYLAYVSANGLVIGSPQVVPLGPNETVNNGTVVGLANGTTLVTYDVFNSQTSERFVRYRIYDDYTDVTGAQNANATPGDDAFGEATALEGGGFVIATQDGLGIRYLFTASNGTGFFSSVPGTTSTPGGSNGFAKAITPEVTALKDGGFMVAWIDTSQKEGDNSPDLRIGLQRFGSDGKPIGENLFINSPGDQSLSSIDTLADGRVIVTFSSETGDSTGVNTLKYQIVDPREKNLFGSTGDDNIVGREDGSVISGGGGADKLIGREAADTLLGGTGIDHLLGAGGSDVLNGGSEADRMEGGTGNDRYVVDSASDRVIEAAGAGADEVLTSVSYTLGTGQAVERLRTTSQAGTSSINLTGNELGNQIIGNAGTNVERGLAGNDVLSGLGGNDTLLGGIGNDVLTGGLGRDILTGEAGRDRFDFNATAETAVGANRDVVTFVRSEGDKIDLSTIDADTDGTVGNQAFRWVNQADLDAAFSGVDGQLRFAGGILSGDVNGDRKADFEIQIKGALAAVDVIL